MFTRLMQYILTNATSQRQCIRQLVLFAVLQTTFLYKPFLNRMVSSVELLSVSTTAVTVS